LDNKANQEDQPFEEPTTTSENLTLKDNTTEITYPTSELVLFPKVLSATPAPLGIAIAIPVNSPIVVPREDISFVGQSLQKKPENARTRANNEPMNAHNRSPSNSLTSEYFISLKSRITDPNVIPKTGPMIGETEKEKETKVSFVG